MVIAIDQDTIDNVVGPIMAQVGAGEHNRQPPPGAGGQTARAGWITAEMECNSPKKTGHPICPGFYVRGLFICLLFPIPRLSTPIYNTNQDFGVYERE